MGFSSWLYTNSTKQQVVKIVHPGGHAELHDRPVLASEIILRNPRCCVAHPNLFQQPWAIVSPETTLMPGQKFYVVPITTVRRLQKLSLMYYPSHQPQTSHHCNVKGEESEGDHSSSSTTTTTAATTTTCWLFKHINTRDNRDGMSSNDSYCTCLLRGNKIKANNSEDSSKEFTRLTSNFKSTERNTDTSRKRNINDKRLISLDQWQPGLESVCEE